MPTSSRCRRGQASLAGAVLASAVTALLTVVPGVVAQAGTPPTGPPPDADASCQTRPLSYPGNGVPVPAEASCALVTTSADLPVAEVWGWRDDAGLHWYNYVAEGYTLGAGSALTMCATEDEVAADVAYECTTDSYFLLFTMPNLYVTWPSVVDDDLYFCESVDVVGADGLPVSSHACGRLGTADAVESIPTATTAAPSPTAVSPTPEPSPPVEVSTPVPPTVAVTEEPEPLDEPTSQPAASSPSPPAPAPPEPGAAPPPAPDGADPRPSEEEGEEQEDAVATAEDDPAPAEAMPVATPVDSESVALVGGAAFPVALVFILAAALALGGVGVLAGPSVVAAFRRRA